VFKFEKNHLTINELENESTEWLIDGLLVEQTVNMFFAPPKHGKTWFLLGVAKELARRGVKKIFYFDRDNPKRQIKDRGVGALIGDFKNIVYLTRSHMGNAKEFLESVENEAREESYRGCVFIFDSTRDFVADASVDTQAKIFMETMKNIREAGGTVILAHHATKNGKVMHGSAEFMNGCDNIFELRQKERRDDNLDFTLKVFIDRDPIEGGEYSVELSSLNLTLLGGDEANGGLFGEDRERVNKALVALESSEGMSRSALVLAMGFLIRSDRNGLNLITKGEDKFWVTKRVNGNKILYFIKE
jgi:hypothetical protein